MENKNDAMLEITMSDFASQDSKLEIDKELLLRVKLVPQNTKIQYAVNSIDVVVLAPYKNIKVKELRQSLPLPSDPNATVQFTIIADRPGTYELEVLLLIANQSIHNAKYSFRVI